MSPEQYAAIKQLFAAVADLPPAARAAALAGLTDDTEVITEVLGLHAVTTATALAWQPIASALTEAVAPPQVALGSTLGVWRIEREIGQGGMGRVFLAARNDGHFEQHGALKLLSGLPSADALARFTRERQLLATLTHPNIARLLDGGATPAHQPYLVMEHVAGAHIDEHCRRAQLATHAVLALFLTSCDAVAFAHRQLVIHCDLKPSNLLVDGAGRPVLLDFGIARLLGRVEADGPAGVPAAAHAFTPRYASPEQRAGGAVSTASDIYSLGVLLGELLAAAPDHRLLPPLRRRELAAIVERTTREDPAARYATVDALTADIRRFLDRRPIQAWQGRRGYALRKLLVRRWPVAATALVLALVVAAASVQVLTESHRARAAERSARAAEVKAVQDRDRAARAEVAARQTSDFLVSIFRGSNPEAEITPVPASKLIAQAEQRLDSELQGQPIALADIHGALGHVQQNLGNRDQARAHFQRAIALERGLHRPLDLAARLADLIHLRLALFDPASCEADAREALALDERFAGPEAAATVVARNLLADILGELGRPAEAEALVRHNVTIARKHGPHQELAESLDYLGSMLSGEAKYDEAIAVLHRSQDLYAALGGKDGRDYLEMWQELGRTLSAAHRYDEAVAAFRASFAGMRKTIGADSPAAAWAAAELARALDGAGRPREALPLFHEAIAITGRKLGPRSTSFGMMHNNLAIAEYHAGDRRAARHDWLRALSLLAEATTEKDLAMIRTSLAVALIDAGDLDAAYPQIAAAVKARVAALGENNPLALDSRVVLAAWYVSKGDAAHAVPELTRLRPLIPASLPTRIVMVERQLALAQALTGDTAAAVRGLERAEELERRYYGAGHLFCALGQVPRAELLARGTAEQRAAGAALAAAILERVGGALVPDAPLLAHLRQLAAAPRATR